MTHIVNLIYGHFPHQNFQKKGKSLSHPILILLTLLSPFYLSYGLSRAGGTPPTGELIFSADVFVLPPRTPAVGDLYVLDEEAKTELRRMGKILIRYQADIALPEKPISSLAQWDEYLSRSAFIENAVMGPEVEYRTVNDLSKAPAPCNAMESPSVYEYASHRLMCTVGKTTYIQNSATPQYGLMGLREFVGHLIHERAHALHIQPSPEHHFFSDLQRGLAEALQLEDVQNRKDLQAKGEWVRPTPYQLDLLKNLLASVQELRLGETRLPNPTLNRALYEVHPNGGGLFRKGTRVDETAFLSVTSVLGEGSQASQGSVIFNSVCDAIILQEKSWVKDLLNPPHLDSDFRFTLQSNGLCKIGKNALLKDTAVYSTQLLSASVELEENAKIDSIRGQGSWKIWVNAGSSLLNSDLEGTRFQSAGIWLQPNSAVTDLTLGQVSRTVIGERSKIEHVNMQIKLENLVFHNNAQLSSVSLLGSSSNVPGQNNGLGALYFAPKSLIVGSGRQESLCGAGREISVPTKQTIRKLDDLRKLCQQNK